MAETVWKIRHGIDADDGLAWDGRFMKALIASGHGDMPAILPELLDSQQWITVLRTDMEKEWSQIDALAQRLLEQGTLRGAEIRKMFTTGAANHQSGHRSRNRADH